MSASERKAELEADAARNDQLKTPVEARQAVKTRHVRWVLVISLTLGVVALGGAYAWYESMHSQAPALASDQRSANGQAQLDRQKAKAAGSREPAASFVSPPTVATARAG